MLTPKTPKFRLALAPALALVAMLPIASAAQAGDAAEDIVVTSPEKMAAWKAQTNDALNRALESEPWRSNLRPAAGIVQLTFELDEAGKPDNIKLYSSTGSWSSIRTARKAVRRLGDLSDVPVTNARDATFIANIIFADSQEQYYEFASTLEQSERARLASAPEQGEPIVLGG